jgi:hypothetical protein
MKKITSNVNNPTYKNDLQAYNSAKSLKAKIYLCL